MGATQVNPPAQPAGLNVFDGNRKGLSAFGAMVDGMDGSHPTVVHGLLLHGHDEVPDSLAAVAARWQQTHGLVLARPAAPLLSDEAGEGRAWWRTDEEGPGADTLQALLDLLAPWPPRRLGDHPLPNHRSVLIAGFSQGAAVAAAVAAAAVRDRSLQDSRVMVVVVAGFLPQPLDVPAAPPGADLAMLVITGALDAVVDPFHGELLARRFRRRGWDVAEASHPGGHQWDGAVTDIAAAWLAAHVEQTR